jgi:hypothetical protein
MDMKPQRIHSDWLIPDARNGFPTAYFDPPSFTEFPELAEAHAYQERAQIERHPFFDVASRRADALRMWAEQEAVVTGPFSQLLLMLGSKITNVHLRAVFLPVVTGEHHRLQQGIASASHPWLLNKLCLSIGVKTHTIAPSAAVLQFVSVLEHQCGQAMRGIGALAVGNERMLIPEYTAVRACFESVYPNADFAPFLDANIDEDREHTMLLERVAAGLVGFGHAPSDFLRGAQEGVDARVQYYDALLRMIS